VNVTARPATPDDAPFLLAVYASTREEELALVGWTDEQKAAFCASQFAAQDAWYRENYPGATYDVVLVDGEPAGRRYVARWPDEIRLMDIALLPAYRGRGIGSRLLDELLAEADAAGRRTSVHVEKFNRARSLYERLGFVEAEDKGVYVLLERPVVSAVPS
jgi:ribosomal protein S18 acetylase RimI-like enzyme